MVLSTVIMIILWVCHRYQTSFVKNTIFYLYAASTPGAANLIRGKKCLQKYYAIYE